MAASESNPFGVQTEDMGLQKEHSDNKQLGWKVLGTFVLAFAIAWVGGVVWGIGVTQIGRLLQFSATTISTASLLGIAIIRMVVWIPITHIVLKRRLREVAFQFHRGWWADLLAGVAITSLAILVGFIVAVKMGWLIIEGWMWQLLPVDLLLDKLWISLLINALVALVEEIVFRAYLLTGLKEAWGKLIGLTVMAVIFSLMHTPALKGNTPFMVAWALLLLAAFGMMFGWAYLRTSSLWLPIGIHFAWDFVENDLLNLSGNMANPHVIGAMARLVGPSPLAGMGNALLLDTLVLAILSLGIWLWLSNLRFRRPTPIGYHTKMEGLK